MGYESKVIFKTVMDILATSETLEEAMERVAYVANTDEFVLAPRKQAKAETQKEE